MEDLTGKQFTRLTVVGFHGRIKSRRYWDVKCSCGCEKHVQHECLISGATRSCGCFKADKLGDSRRTSAFFHPSTYRSYMAMLTRCSNPNSFSYKNYGGRGIRVCTRWKKSFENFLHDMGERPAGNSLDRKRVNGNYCKSNCKWSTHQEQAQNTRANKLTSKDVINIRKRKNRGESASKLAKEYGIDSNYLHQVVRGRSWGNIHS